MNLQLHTFFSAIFIIIAVMPVEGLSAPEFSPNMPNKVQLGQEIPNGLRTQMPRRRPPQIAIDACSGKNEGDNCSFFAPEGLRSGECLTGAENVFACRPHRGAAPQPEKTPRTETAQPLSPRSEPQNTSKTIPKPESPEDIKSDQPKELVPTSSPAGNSKDQIPSKSPELQQVQTPVPVVSESRPEIIAHEPPPAIPPALDKYAGQIGTYLLVALGSAIMVWYGFYRYSTVPLRRLRKVTQLLAGGDLSARVGEGLVHRKNEVADLGRDVDRMAERIESLVGAQQRLIRDVSHELRSPLARLNVALELARQSAGPTHSAPFDRIERESDRLNELIGHLLMLTKLESESGTGQRSLLDISELITGIAQDADFEAKGNDRRVVATVSEQLQLSGNKELLRQAIENLVRNAVKYTAPGTSVEISLKKRESGGRSWAHIEVRDQGPGVPESELYDIFRPFYRVGDSRERQSGGTGVGLAISDRAVRLHGGSLRAFNAPGNGLIMEMELPLV